MNNLEVIQKYKPTGEIIAVAFTGFVSPVLGEVIVSPYSEHSGEFTDLWKAYRGKGVFQVITLESAIADKYNQDYLLRFRDMIEFKEWLKEFEKDVHCELKVREIKPTKTNFKTKI